MDDAELRLECLSLAARPGLDPQEILATATVFYRWVASTPTTPISGPADSSKASATAPAASHRTSPPNQNRVAQRPAQS